MQILSNALPGFRDLRGPVIAGYMWLVFAWLLAAPDWSTRPDDRIGGGLYDLRQDIGRAGLFAAVSVAAYLIGSISQQATESLLGRPFRVLIATVEELLFPFDRAVASSRVGQYDPERVMALVRRGDEILRDESGNLSSEQLEDLRSELGDRSRTAEQEARRELNLPATLLVGERPELFAEVDRLRAEGELRLAVGPPLFALALLLAVAQRLYWLLALVPIGFLVQQGVRREAESRKVIADAIAFGTVESPSLRKLEVWVRDSLPQLIEQAQKGLSIRTSAFQ